MCVVISKPHSIWKKKENGMIFLDDSVNYK